MAKLPSYINEANFAGANKPKPAKKKAKPVDNQPTRDQIIDSYNAAIEAGDKELADIWFDAYDDLTQETY